MASQCHPASEIPLQLAGSGECYNVAFNPDGTLVAVVGRQPWAVYETNTGRPREFRRLPTTSPPRGNSWSTAAAFSPDGKSLAIGFGNAGYGAVSGPVEIWDLEGKQPVRTFSRHLFCVYGLAFSHDGKFLAGACGSYYTPAHFGEVKIWDVSSGSEVATREAI